MQIAYKGLSVLLVLRVSNKQEKKEELYVS